MSTDLGWPEERVGGKLVECVATIVMMVNVGGSCITAGTVSLAQKGERPANNAGISYWERLHNYTN